MHILMNPAAKLRGTRGRAVFPSATSAMSGEGTAGKVYRKLMDKMRADTKLADRYRRLGA